MRRHSPDGSIRIGGTDVDELVRYLLGLGVQLQVVSPPSVRDAFRSHLRALLES